MNVQEIILEAQAEAISAARAMENQLAGRMDACGFASVEIYRFNEKTIRKNSKMGKALEELGITKSYSKSYNWWNPSDMPTQSITIKEAGAQAAAKVLKSYGFTAYATSRMD